MHFVVFDLEWNMAHRSDRIPEDLREQMPFEIIEIGAVKLTETGDELGRFSQRVKPVLYTKMHARVGEVTQRSDLSLKTGETFPLVYEAFRCFCGEEALLCTWSMNDSEPLKRNLAFHGLPSQLEQRILDVQLAFSAVAEGDKSHQRSIAYALDFLRYEKDLPFHTAVADARYTARILKALLGFQEEEGLSLEDFIRAYTYDPDLKQSEQLSFEYEEQWRRQDILQDLVRKGFACPACQSKLEMTEAFSAEGRHQQAKAYCAEHGPILLRCRFYRKTGKLTHQVAQVQLKLLEP